MSRIFNELAFHRMAEPCARISRRIKRNGECREWTGTIGNKRRDPRPILSIKHRNILVYRIVWEESFGKIPDGMMVCHSCDNGLCLRTSHLFLGTAKDNMKDKTQKGRGSMMFVTGYDPRRKRHVRHS